MKMLRGLMPGLVGILALGAAQAARIDTFTGGALFAPASAIRSYYAQSKSGSKPLLQIYYFLNDTSHYFIQLRDNGSGEGVASYQGYVEGRKLAGNGTCTVGAGALVVRAEGGFVFIAKVRGARIRLLFKNEFGTYRGAGRLHKFVR